MQGRTLIMAGLVVSLLTAAPTAAAQVGPGSIDGGAAKGGEVVQSQSPEVWNASERGRVDEWVEVFLGRWGAETKAPLGRQDVEASLVMSEDELRKSVYQHEVRSHNHLYHSKFRARKTHMDLSLRTILSWGHGEIKYQDLVELTRRLETARTSYRGGV